MSHGRIEMHPFLWIFFLVLSLAVVLATLWLAWHGVAEAWRTALETSTTRGFLNHAWDAMPFHNVLGLAMVVLAGVPLLLAASLVVAVRVLRGAGGGVTARNLAGLFVGAVVGPLVCGAAAFAVVFVLGMLLQPHALRGGVVGALSTFPSNAWIVGGVGLPAGALLGFTNTAPRRLPAGAPRPEAAVGAASPEGSAACYLCGNPLQPGESASGVCPVCRM